MQITIQQIQALAQQGRLAFRVQGSFGQTAGGEHNSAGGEIEIGAEEVADFFGPEGGNLFLPSGVLGGSRFGCYSFRVLPEGGALQGAERRFDADNLAWQRALLK